jgi:hypothetical protein
MKLNLSTKKRMTRAEVDELIDRGAALSGLPVDPVMRMVYKNRLWELLQRKPVKMKLKRSKSKQRRKRNA